MWTTSKNFLKAGLGKAAALLTTFPLWKTLYNLIDAWGNLQMITDYLPRIWQFINTTTGTLVVMCIGLALTVLQLYRQQRQRRLDEETDAELSNSIYTNAGVMFQSLESQHELIWKQYWGRHFWAIGYGAWSTGNITEEVVKKYLEHHRHPSNRETGDFIPE